jgi:hypothetical protein
MGMLQTVMATTSLFCMSLNQLYALILAAKTVVTAQADLAILDVAFDSLRVGHPCRLSWPVASLAHCQCHAL